MERYLMSGKTLDPTTISNYADYLVGKQIRDTITSIDSERGIYMIRIEFTDRSWVEILPQGYTALNVALGIG
jgi:hypothetical protein